MSRLPKLVIFGRQGAGKGTVGQRVASHLGIHHISTGEMLRREMAEGTPLGLEVQAYVDHGDLVPVESLTSRETFHARVSGPQEVEIYAGSPMTPTVDAAPRDPSPWLAARRGTADASAQANSKTRSTK